MSNHLLPKVSVVIPTYNRADTLGEAIESALTQTIPPREVIVVDDGSTDNTAAICRRYPVIYRKIGRSGNPAKPRNVGTSMAKGPLIAFLDSDDRWLSRRLERQLPEFRDSSIGLVHSDAVIVDHGRRRKTGVMKRRPKVTGDLLPSLLRENIVTTSTVLVRKQIIMNAGGFDEFVGKYGFEDYHLWLRLAIQGTRFVYIAEPLVEYRQMPDSLSTMGTYAGRKRELTVLERLPNLPRQYNLLLRYRRSRLCYELSRIASHPLERISFAIKALVQFPYGQIAYREASQRIRRLFWSPTEGQL